MSGAPQAGAAANPSSLAFLQFVPFILIFLVMYFLVIRPQKKKQKEREQLLAELKKGDKVVTSGGVIGIIADLDQDVVTLKIGEGAKLELRRDHVVEVVKN